MSSAAAALDVGRGSPARALEGELERAGVPYVVLREACGEVRLLVPAEDLGRFQSVAGRLGRRVPTPGDARSATYVLEDGRAGAGTRVHAATELRYGKRVRWLTTGEPERLIVRRAVVRDGSRVAAPQDELLDTLLHCLVDLGAFPPEHRRRLSELMAELRADAPAAGRAAERVQQELAPALTWSDVLAAVVCERWDALLARRRALRLQALARSPVRSPLRWMSAALASRATRPEASGNVAASAAAGSPKPEGVPAEARTDALSRKQIRGSGLLLSGRGLATGIKLVAELLVVRYLTTAEYGSWTYALAAVTLLKGFAALGLHRAVARFVPMHVERGERDDLMGVLALVLGCLLVAGLTVVVTFHAFPGLVAGLVGAAPDQSLDILFIVIFLVPVEAIDDLLTNVCAAFSSSRTIFVRRYLLGPGLRLGIACLLVALQADVRLLAYGYLLSGLAGVAYYAWSVVGEARRRGLVRWPLEVRLRLPVRRVLSYTVLVMGADLCAILMVTTAPLLLGYFAGMSEVALFQVVVPLVALNNVVAQTFGILFEPAASRLQARGDHAGLERLYWRSAAWVAVLSFPAFAICLGAAAPLTHALFGERYAPAAPILSLLAIGAFVEASLGFNNAALRVLGKVRWLLAVNAIAVALNVAMNVALIPRLGALGAAIATGSAMLAGALMKQGALRLSTGVRLFDASYTELYAVMALVTAGLAALRVAGVDDASILALATVLAAGVVLARAREVLSVSETFPELVRWPALARLLG